MYVLPNCRYSSKCFHDGAPVCGTINMAVGKYCKWLCRRLIISTKQTSIYISTFANALTFKKAKNHEMGIYIFLTNVIVAFCHAPP